MPVRRMVVTQLPQRLKLTFLTFFFLYSAARPLSDTNCALCSIQFKNLKKKKIDFSLWVKNFGFSKMNFSPNFSPLSFIIFEIYDVSRDYCRIVPFFVTAAMAKSIFFSSVEIIQTFSRKNIVRIWAKIAELRHDPLFLDRDPLRSLGP